jgi:hypothetical protein
VAGDAEVDEGGDRFVWVSFAPASISGRRVDNIASFSSFGPTAGAYIRSLLSST